MKYCSVYFIYKPLVVIFCLVCCKTIILQYTKEYLKSVKMFYKSFAPLQVEKAASLTATVAEASGER